MNCLSLMIGHICMSEMMRKRSCFMRTAFGGHVRFERIKKLRSCSKIRMMREQYRCLCFQFVSKIKMERIILFVKIGNLKEKNVFRRCQFRSSVRIKVAKTLYFQSILQATQASINLTFSLNKETPTPTPTPAPTPAPAPTPGPAPRFTDTP